MRHFCNPIIFYVLAVLLAGCAPIHMPKIDLSEPQWDVRNGQALWKQPSGGMQLTGDLLVAENPRGDMYISLTKSLIPIFMARTWERTWSIDFVARGQSHQGRGKPPSRRFVWFALPDILQGQAPPPPWTVTRKGSQYRIADVRTGEEILVVIEP